MKYYDRNVLFSVTVVHDSIKYLVIVSFDI